MAVPPPSIALDKAGLRKALRGARVAFVAASDAATLAHHHATLADRLSHLLERAGPIAGYVAHRGEPDIVPALRRAHDRGCIVALPVVAANGGMHFVRWHPDAALTPGSLGILQPDAGGEAVIPAIVLAPLVGFDRCGGRLGQGGGYYDRWFAAHPDARRIGIAWSVQEVAALPRDPWDMPLHAVATERKWIAP